MKKYLLVVAILFSLYAQSQSIKTFEAFQPYLEANNDSIYVINFWATWCKPCVEELPYFEQLHLQYKNQKVKVVLVSLDFKSQFEKKLLPFVKQKNITAETILLNETDYNNWLPKVNKTWSGAIPATLIMYKPSNTHIFFEKELANFAELENYILPILKK